MIDANRLKRPERSAIDAPLNGGALAALLHAAGPQDFAGTGGHPAAIINGTGGNDTLNGGDGNDRLDGGDGDDRIDGQNGDDILVFTGPGNDGAFGGAGNDTLIADFSTDTVGASQGATFQTDPGGGYKGVF